MNNKKLEDNTYFELDNIKNRVNNPQDKGIAISKSDSTTAEEFPISLEEIKSKILNTSNNNTVKSQGYTHKPFLNNQKNKESEQLAFKDTVHAEVLDLSNTKDLDKFNILLNEHNDPKGNVKLDIIDRRYAEKEGKFIVFVMYTKYKFVNPLESKNNI